MGMLIILILGFIIGVVFISTAKTGSAKPILITSIIGMALGILFAAVRVVPAGYVGILDFFGNVSNQPLKSGINLVNPLARVVILSIRT